VIVSATYRAPDRAHRRVLVVAVLIAHAAAIWALLQEREVRRPSEPAEPLFVSLVAPRALALRAAEVRPPAPYAPPRRKAAAALPIAATPAPAPAAWLAPAQPETEAIEASAASPAVAVAVAAGTPDPVAPAAVAPTPAPVVKTIPAFAVQYLEAIVLDYPRVSRRLGETGRVLIRVFIDEAGAARQLAVSRSSGHARLDEAALAAVQKARFRPYRENGQPVAGWAFIPLEFELER